MVSFVCFFLSDGSANVKTIFMKEELKGEWQGLAPAGKGNLS